MLAFYLVPRCQQQTPPTKHSTQHEKTASCFAVLLFRTESVQPEIRDYWRGFPRLYYSLIQYVKVALEARRASYILTNDGVFDHARNYKTFSQQKFASNLRISNG
jgi:hypothetical protein